jgi:hypothetical protein
MGELNLSAWWMPFTANRQFRTAPMLLERASGMHYYTPDGREVLDGAAGLWCVNAGHGRREIVEAVSDAITELDYAPPFKIGHPLAFRGRDRAQDRPRLSSRPRRDRARVADRARARVPRRQFRRHLGRRVGA